jgi:pimeloyl-ACP methyl ester carboxylesterase
MSALAGYPAHRGALVDIGGRGLRLVCEGPPDARPVVWFEHGAFGQAEDFAVVQARLVAQGVRSCAYDRAGLGLSDPGPEPRDSSAIQADRDALIARAGMTGPFVVVAHSFGGIHARRWIADRPGEVVGLVLVDASEPEAIESPGAQVWVRRFGQFARVAQACRR